MTNNINPVATLPVPVNGTCVTCGDSDFILATDLVEYAPCDYVDGTFTPAYGHTEESMADDAVRFDVFLHMCVVQRAKWLLDMS